jgi:hypothetical protein
MTMFWNHFSNLPTTGRSTARRRAGRSRVSIEALETRVVLSASPVADAGLFRAYNPVADYHFFTSSRAEFDNAVGAGYVDETAGRSGIRVAENPAPGLAPVYRLYNLQTGRHYYTVNTAERDLLVAINPPPVSGPDLRVTGWRFEKIEGYVRPGAADQTVEVHRLYNKSTGVHLYLESGAAAEQILKNFPGVWERHTSFGFAAFRSADDSRGLGYRAAPLRTIELNVEGRGLSSSDEIEVEFRRGNDSLATVRAAGVVGNTLVSAVPTGIAAGTVVSVHVRHRGTTFQVFSEFRVDDLPSTGVADGEVLRAYLDELEQELSRHRNAFEAVRKASAGGVDVSGLLARLDSRRASIAEVRDLVSRLSSGAAQTVEIGRRADGSTSIRLSRGDLALLDRAIAAAVLDDSGDRSSGAEIGQREGRAGWERRLDDQFRRDTTGTKLERTEALLHRLARAAASIPSTAASGAYAVWFALANGSALSAVAAEAGHLSRDHAEDPFRAYDDRLAPGVRTTADDSETRVYSTVSASGLLGRARDDGRRLTDDLDDSRTEGFSRRSRQARESGGLRKAGGRPSIGQVELSERSGSSIVEVRDIAPRAASVTLRARVTDDSEAVVLPSQITILPGDDLDRVEFEVRGRDDLIQDNDRELELEFEVESEDPAFRGLRVTPVRLRTLDDGRRGADDSPDSPDDSDSPDAPDSPDDSPDTPDAPDSPDTEDAPPIVRGRYAGTATGNFSSAGPTRALDANIVSQAGGSISGTVTTRDVSGMSTVLTGTGTVSRRQGTTRIVLNLSDGSRLEVFGERTAYRGTLASVENGLAVTFSVALSFTP